MARKLVALIFFILSFASSKAQNIYCSSGATDTSNADITRVDIRWVNGTNAHLVCVSYHNTQVNLYNAIGYSSLGLVGQGQSGSYTDFTALKTIVPLKPRIPYRVIMSTDTLYIHNRDSFPHMGMKIYIDYNHDGLFTDSSELALKKFSSNYNNTIWGYNGATLNGIPFPGIGFPFNGISFRQQVQPQVILYTITVPPTALQGPTRMRVIMQQLDSTHTTADSIKPCGAYLFGETEDYMVIIDPRPFCEDSVIVAGAIIPTSPITLCQKDSLVLKTIGTTNVSNLQFQWLTSNDGINYNSLAGATKDSFIIVPNSSSAYYKLAIRCPVSNDRDTTAAAFVQVLPSLYAVDTTLCFGNNYLGYTNTGTYIDTFSNTLGCDSIVTLQLQILPLAIDSITAIICQGDSFLGYSSNGTFIDTFTNTNGCDSFRVVQLSVLPISTATISASICAGASFQNYNSSGTYIDTFLNAQGCDSIRTLQLLVHPYSISSINASICNGQVYQGYTASGTYIDTFINANGCDSVRTLQLNVIQMQVQITASTNTICPGATSTLTAIGNGSMYQWQPMNQSGTSMQVAPSNSSIYTVVASNNIGCTSSATVLINLYASPVLSMQPSSSLLCLGDSAALSVIGASTYQWLPNNAISSNQGNSVVVFPTSNTNYTVVATDLNGCTATALSNITVKDVQINISILQQSWCKGSLMQVEVESNELLQYNWYPDNLYGNSSVFAQKLGTSGWIKVVGRDNNNCVGIDSFYAKAENCCKVLLPNAFSPNQDNINEEFKILNPEAIDLIGLTIYNRWGQVVFASKDIYQSWLGLKDGLPLDNGTYFYKIDFECKGRQILQGSVDLVR